MTCQYIKRDRYDVLSFSGEAANWPSKSNDADIKYKGGKPRVVHTKEFHARMAYIKLCYRQAAKLAFGKENVLAVCLLGSNARMRDSHNFCKTFGDFAEEVGMVDNDSQLTIWCLHKKHYGIIGVNDTTLDILIKPAAQFEMLQFIKDFTT